ncbi:hypothetical protein B0T49_21880 [Chromobacterium violaceum]|nr:hypothetical protein B0T49_21880 [Chromobacterium violaceum]OQS49686.1 hypothetical protein B0T48_05500 [Chromobacterium violaceum]
MAGWALYWQAMSTVTTVILGAVGLYKIYHELLRLNQQKEKDAYDIKNAAKLKRVEFFLAQHRRLFDDSDLHEVRCLLDSDSIKLKQTKNWEKKRKFLTFMEEIALMVQANQIDREVALYMFGYYAQCAMYGENFKFGIELSEKYWGLFYSFCADADEFYENLEKLSKEELKEKLNKLGL